jgi:hypothetical protein
MNTISQSDLNRQNNNELAVMSSIKIEGGLPKAHNTEKVNDLNAFGDDGLTFGDFIDIINPLHHLPVIGTLYREITGDSLDPASKVLGGSLFLGPLGSVSALVNVLVNESTGKDLTEHAFAMFENTNTSQPEVSKNKTSSNEKLDPVTAWAIAEASFRQTTSKEDAITDKSIYDQAVFKNGVASDFQAASVTEWAKSEVSFRKASSKATISHIKETKNTEEAMASFRNNILTDRIFPVVPAALETDRSIHSRTKDIVAIYKRQQSMPIKNTNAELVKFETKPPAGAIATGGGWFSDTMMSALGKTNNIRKPIQY